MLFVMSLRQFLVVSQMIFVLDQRCDRVFRGGPWISRHGNGYFVLLPTGRVADCWSLPTALYAHEAAWAGVIPHKEVYDYCDAATDSVLRQRHLTALQDCLPAANGTRPPKPVQFPPAC